MFDKSDWQRRKYHRELIQKIPIYSLLIAGSAIFLFPLFWMVSTSLKTPEQIFIFPPSLLPNPVRLQNYVDTVNYIPFFRYALNTLYICALGVIGITISSSLVAYGFSRIEWPGRDIFFIVTIATMMIPFAVLMIPLYVLFRKVGWIGSFKPLWVPAWFASAWDIFLLRQFFMTIPKDLSDAARIDGASEFCIFRTIIIPLAKPALAVVALFHFLYAWRDFLGPLIYLIDPQMFTLSLGLQQYQSQHGGTEWGMLMAASCLITFPIIILFFFTQKTFIQGISLTGLKE